MRPHYAGRDAGASPATGLAKRHAAEQAALIADALGHSSRAAAAAARPVKGTRMATDVKVPTLGESITEGTLAQWLKKPGEAVAADEPIASLETDKVTVEVPSPVAGVLGEQLVKEGDTVAVGAVIARIDEGGSGCGARARAGRGRRDDQSGRRRREPGAARRRACAGGRQADGRRSDADRDHPVARGAPRGARASCRPVEDQGHRQGRAADQGRRDRRRARRRRAGSPAQAGAQAPEAKAPAPEAKRSASWAPAFAGERDAKSASR